MQPDIMFCKSVMFAVVVAVTLGSGSAASGLVRWVEAQGHGDQSSVVDCQALKQVWETDKTLLTSQQQSMIKLLVKERVLKHVSCGGPEGQSGSKEDAVRFMQQLEMWKAGASDEQQQQVVDIIAAVRDRLQLPSCRHL